MWVAKIKFSGADSILGSKALKFNVLLWGYPVSFCKRDNEIHVFVVGFISGIEKNKKEFLKNIKTDKRVLNFQANGDFLLLQIREKVIFDPIYNHKIIHLEPVYIREDGSEIWTLGSWCKNELTKFVNLVEKTHRGILLKFKRENITDFSILSVQPRLTSKQRKAMELAVEKGYYNYPKNVELNDLAKLMGVSYSTYHAHLRKAEQRLLPHFFAHSKR